MGTKILDNVDNVKEKINIFFNFWKNAKEEFAKQKIFCVLSGSPNPYEDSTMQERFQLWLNEYQLTDTLFIFFKETEKILIFANDKKKKFLQPLLEEKNIDFIERNENNTENFSKIKDLIEKENVDEIAILKDKEGKGAFFNSCDDFIKSLNKKEFNADDFANTIMTFRSQSDLKVLQDAGNIACTILKSTLISNIEGALDNEDFETHDKIKDKALNFNDNKKCVTRLKDKFKVDLDEIEIIYSNVQSGNKYSLTFKNSDDKNYLSQNDGTIIVALGLKYKELCCNITRTLLLNAKDIHKELYNFTLKIFKYVINDLIKVNNSFSLIYTKTIEFIEAKAKEECPNLKSIDLKNYFVKHVGHIIGMEFLQKEFLIREKNENIKIEKNTSYNISIGFENVDAFDEKKTSTWISDTIYVNSNENVVVLTDTISKEINAVSYELEEGSSEEESKVEVKEEKGKDKKKNGETKKKTGVSSSVLNNASSVIVSDRLRRRNKNSMAHTNEQEVEELKKKQQELRKKKINEIRNRFAKGTEEVGNLNNKKVKKMEDIKSYSDPDLFPKDLKTNKIHVDNKHECILVPVNGVHIPFHVSTIKNLSSNYESNSDMFVLRINFLIPGNQGSLKGDTANVFPSLQLNEMYIKELLFKSKYEDHLQKIVKQVKELIKLVKQRQEEADVIDAKISHEKLNLNKSGRRIILRDLMIRPALFTGRKILGTLELHTNGLRYSANSKGTTEYIDILFDEVKYAFYQPCDGQLIILIHFHLKRYIMVGKKKTLDVQFYCEAGTQIDDVDRVRGRNAYDPDETQAEIRERELKSKLNTIFKNFVEQIQDASKLEFEIPYRELTFTGVPNKSNVEIFITANTINHLVDWPPFILSVDDIEIASLERVHHGLRNFDLIFVFKDYTKPVRRIDVIPIEYIDTIKKWLTTIEIVYYEGKNNLQWGNILKAILADTDEFAKSGGFEEFLGDHDDEDIDEDEDADEDEEYEVDSEESEYEESEYEDTDEESLATESEGDEEYAEDSEEDEGLTWEELEEQAKKEDKKRGAFLSDDDDNFKRKKKKR